MKESSLKNTNLQDKQESTSNELLEKVPIEDTPFTAIRFENKWFLTMGKYRLTEPVDTLEAVQIDAQRADWYRVMQIINLMIEEKLTNHIKN